MQQQISTLKQRNILDREYKLRLTIVFLIGLAFLALVFLLSMIPFYYFVQIKESLIDEQYKKVQKENIEQNEASLNKQVKDMADVVNLFKPTLEDLNLQKDLVGILPTADSGVKVLGFSWSKATNEVYIKGQATNRNTLLSYVKKLQSDDRFSNADVPVSNLTKSTDLDFNLKLIYKNK